MRLLQEPIALPNGTRLCGRVFKAAMSEALATADGRVTPELLELYKDWAFVPAAGFLTGNIQVDRRYLEHGLNVVADDAHGGGAALAPWPAAVGGERLWAQLNHAGRQTPAAICATAPAPSAVSVEIDGYADAIEMTEEDIADAVARFATAAGLVQSAGFGGIQIHAAHGYLLSSFLSPHVNRRTDRWGGSVANRARLLLAVVDAVRTAVGRTMAIAVKLNASDFRRGGFSPQDAAEVAERLEGRIDLLEISGGTFETPRAYSINARSAGAADDSREAFFLSQAKRIRARTSTPLMLTGGWRSRVAIASAINDGLVDAVGLARPFISDPDGVTALIEGHADTVASPERNVPEGTAQRDVLDWFCWQLYLRGTEGAPDLALPIDIGARRHRERQPVSQVRT